MFDHITTGVDPDPLNYDAMIQVNFDQLIDLANGLPATQILYQNNSAVSPTVACFYDLFSVLLHEMTHNLGWVSFIGEGAGPTFFPTTPFGINTFSLYDWKYLFKEPAPAFSPVNK